MRICLLASGSSGNCTYVAGGDTQILIDAGVAHARISHELQAIGADPSKIDALILSHEHGDHRREVGRVASRLRCPVYMSERTLARVRRALAHDEPLTTFRVGEALTIGELHVETFRVFHDAIEPCGFLIEGPSHRSPGRVKVGVATDLGTVTRPLLEQFLDCEGLIIESNHDLQMLKDGDYPWHLKQRIRSPVGHLSNEVAADFVAQLARRGRVKKVLLAHISEDNNHPDLALDAVHARLNGVLDRSVDVYPSYHHRRSEAVEI